MDTKHENIIIGFSGLILFEDCYEYNENACFLAESSHSAIQFMVNCGYNKSNFRIDEISMNMLMCDYGCSSGEYAMELLAFEKFRKIADKMGLKYVWEDFYMDTNLKVVNL